MSQFLNPNREPFDWENEELNESLPEAEEPVYPDVLAEIPGLVLESDLTDDDDAVMEPAEPTFEEWTWNLKKVKDQEGMELVDVNTNAARKYVGEIERGIRYLKEHCRCSVSTLAIAGIKYLAKPIVIRLVYNITVLVNAVPDTLGVSERYLPCKIVTQRKFDFKRDCKVLFGAYVQASDNAMVTNTMHLRTHGCVALGTAGNWQGSTQCFDLDTGKVVSRRIISVLPYPGYIVKRVNEWGKTPRGEKYSDGVKFLNRSREPFDWENE